MNSARATELAPLNAAYHSLRNKPHPTTTSHNTAIKQKPMNATALTACSNVAPCWPRLFSTYLAGVDVEGDCQWQWA